MAAGHRNPGTTDEQVRPGLGPPRFRLATLLIGMTVCCVLLAIYVSFGAYAALMALLFALAVWAHVGANWLGTQLRELGNRPQPHGNAESGITQGRVESRHFAPLTHLYQKSPVARGTVIAVLLGIAFGLLAGGLLIYLVSDEPPSWVTWLAGTAAFGVLGGIWSFALAAFLHAMFKAWSEATQDK